MIPEYSKGYVNSTNCSRYARFAARDLFGIDYKVNPKNNIADAWDMRYFNKIAEHSD